MNKALEAWERIKSAPTIYVGCASDIYTRYPTECKVIEESLKEYAGFQIVFKLSNRDEGKKIHFRLKALNIIKTHFKIADPVGVSFEENSVGFGGLIQIKDLTIEDYNLLREVFSW